VITRSQRLLIYEREALGSARSCDGLLMLLRAANWVLRTGEGVAAAW